MKKILVIFVAVICSVFCAYKVIASSIAEKSLKYNMTVKANNGSYNKFTVYEKGNKKKLVTQGIITYTNTAINENIVYTPQTNTAIKVVAPPENSTMPDTATINEYKKYFTRVGTKVINNYTCTVYKSTAKGIETCVSETYNLPIYLKTPQFEMQVTGIATTPLSDSEFQVPAGTKIQDVSAFMTTNPQSYTNNGNNDSVIKAKVFTDEIMQTKIQVNPNANSTSYADGIKKMYENLKKTPERITVANTSGYKSGHIGTKNVTYIPGDGYVVEGALRPTNIVTSLKNVCANHGFNMYPATPEILEDMLENHYDELYKMGVVPDPTYHSTVFFTVGTNNHLYYTIRNHSAAKLNVKAVSHNDLTRFSLTSQLSTLCVTDVR